MLWTYSSETQGVFGISIQVCLSAMVEMLKVRNLGLRAQKKSILETTFCKKMKVQIIKGINCYYVDS